MTTLTSEFGPHLMLDCRQCDKDKISDLQYVWNFIDTLPDKIGMTKITQPYVFPYEGLIPEDRGITGMVIIAESHITFHSFVEKDYFFFDLFSCKPFDVNPVKQIVAEAFGVKDMEVHHATRGRFFPRTVEERHAATTEASSVIQTITMTPPSFGNTHITEVELLSAVS
ncbi:MAG: S-adenosylmethionine decarboxylase [Vampirovibrionales bacterium]|nr:S-adenosylmethionine decarboxylase [Vampirovibrionales bacterium]